MNRMSNTPPDGDFVRYVEQLSARSAATALAREAVSKGSHGHDTRDPAHAAEAERGKPGTVVSLWAMGKWMLMAWIALQLLTVLVPSAGMLTLPLFIGFAVWLVYRFKKASSGLLVTHLRQLTERVAKEFKQGK